MLQGQQLVRIDAQVATFAARYRNVEQAKEFVHRAAEVDFRRAGAHGFARAVDREQTRGDPIRQAGFGPGRS